MATKKQWDRLYAAEFDLRFMEASKKVGHHPVPTDEEIDAAKKKVTEARADIVKGK